MVNRTGEFAAVPFPLAHLTNIAQKNIELSSSWIAELIQQICRQEPRAGKGQVNLAVKVVISLLIHLGNWKGMRENAVVAHFITTIHREVRFNESRQ